MSWNDERVEILKKLWTEGLSASQIAGRIGGVSRNAVIGKVHRLGLSGRATTSRLKSSRPRLRTAAQQPKRLMKPRFASVGNTALRALYQPDAEPFIPAEELDIPMTERKSIVTATAPKSPACRIANSTPAAPSSPPKSAAATAKSSTCPSCNSPPSPRLKRRMLKFQRSVSGRSARKRHLKLGAAGVHRGMRSGLFSLGACLRLNIAS